MYGTVFQTYGLFDQELHDHKQSQGLVPYWEGFPDETRQVEAGRNDVLGSSRPHLHQIASN